MNREQAEQAIREIGEHVESLRAAGICAEDEADSLTRHLTQWMHRTGIVLLTDKQADRFMKLVADDRLADPQMRDTPMHGPNCAARAGQAPCNCMRYEGCNGMHNGRMSPCWTFNHSDDTVD